MKFWPLLWSNLKRRKARTIFTLLSIVVAFVLFAYLAAVRVAFSAGVEVAGAGFGVPAHHEAILRRGAVEGWREVRDRVPGAEVARDVARGTLLEISAAHGG